MAQRKTKRRSTRSTEVESYPGWMWMLFGLAIGLSVAGAIYMKDRGSLSSQSLASEPASMAAPIASPPVAAAAEPQPQQTEPRFTFYSMLPNFEVVIPEEEAAATPDRAAQVVKEPGTYVLQAGSFTAMADADRRRAELALLGIESRVQQVTIDERTYHRVRIGPMRDLDEVNRVRQRLQEARIDALRIRLGD